jgi:hypothetical protein
MAKFFVTFHQNNASLPYSLKRLKELLRSYIDTVNGGSHKISPQDVAEFEESCRKLTSHESASPLIYYDKRTIKDTQGNDKDVLHIMMYGRDLPFAIVSYEN